MTRTHGFVIFLCLLFSFVSKPRALAQAIQGDCPVAPTERLSESKLTSRTAFLQSIDADSWNDLRKDSAPGACLFGHFPFNQTFEQFSVARDSYLQAENNAVGTRKPVLAQHVEIPETSKITRGEVASAVAVAQTKVANVAAAAAPKSTWSLALNAPEQMINGTASSQSFGGTLSYRLASASGSRMIDFITEGTHTRNWKPASPSIEVDYFDAYLKHVGRHHRKPIGSPVIGSTHNVSGNLHFRIIAACLK